MSHEAAIKALNALSKTRVYHVDVSEHIDHLFKETDRSVIILTGSTLEHVLTEALQAKMPSLNSDETARLFGPEGALGTFANKIRVAQGLGIVDRPMAKRLDIYRAMRNAAAHCVTPISFEDEVFHNAVIQMFSPKYRDEVEVLANYGIRVLFMHLQTIISRSIGVRDAVFDGEESLDVVRELAAMQEAHDVPSPDKAGE